MAADFREKGYVKVPLLDADAVQQLRALYAEHLHGKMDGFHTTLLHESATARRTISDAIIHLVEASLRRFLVDYRALVGNFVVKEPGENSVLPVHQDWSVVSEPEFTALNVWCGLQDITVTNGAIRMYPGSQRLARIPRSPSIPNPYQEAFGQIDAELVTEPVRAGEALIFEGSLVHGSFPNRSGARRLATALIMIPESAQPWHYYYNSKGGKIEKFAIDRDFFDTFRIDQRPQGYAVAEAISWQEQRHDLRAMHRMIDPPQPLLRRVAALFSGNRKKV